MGKIIKNETLHNGPDKAAKDNDAEVLFWLKENVGPLKETLYATIISQHTSKKNKAIWTEALNSYLAERGSRPDFVAEITSISYYRSDAWRFFIVYYVAEKPNRVCRERVAVVYDDEYAIQLKLAML